MEYVVFKSGGRQYKASVGEVIEVDKIKNAGDSVFFDSVLLWVKGEDIKIGNPIVSGVSVSAKVIENKKGKKIRVAKFKAKSRYRRVMGFRPQITAVRIDEIKSGPTMPEKSKEKKKKTSK